MIEIWKLGGSVGVNFGVDIDLHSVIVFVSELKGMMFYYVS